MFCMGLPVVSVNSGGIPFLVKDNENALLVDYDNAEAMAAKIEALVENKISSTALIENAVKRSKQYGEEAVLDKWKALFTTL